MLDYLIKNATIADGTGAPAYQASVGIEGDKIAAIITDGSLPEAKCVIDAEGKLLTPGFIDIHSHADYCIPYDSTGDNMIVQGVTSYVGGNCGSTVAPAYNAEFRDKDLMNRAPRFWKNGQKITWTTFGEWLEFADKAAKGVNYIPLVGHNAIRGSVMGMDFARSATQEEVDQMEVYLKEALDSGAFGMTIMADPGASGHFAGRDEIAQLFKHLEKRDSFVSSHTRHHQSQWPSADGRFFYGVYVGEKADVACGRYHGLLEFMEQFKVTPKLTACYSHLTNAFVTPMPHSQELEDAMIDETLRIFVDEPAAEGYPVYLNIIPHEHSVGVLRHVKENLAQSLKFEPAYQHIKTEDQLLDLLEDPAFREEYKVFLKSGKVKIGMLSPACDAYWSDCFIFVGAKDESVLGKSLLQVTKERMPSYTEKMLYENCYDVLFQMVLEDRELSWALIRDKREYQGVKKLASHPRCMPMADSGSYAMEANKWEGNGTNTGNYPLAWTAFVRYLVDVCRDGGCIGMEEAIRKITSLPADVVKLTDRGRIEVGKVADLVLMDWDKLGYVIDFHKPNTPPTGFDYVWVNGVPAMEHGALTRKLTGKVIRKPVE